MKSSFDGPQHEKIGLLDIRRMEPIEQDLQPKPIDILFKEVVREYSLEGAAYHMMSHERSMLIEYFLPIAMPSKEMGLDNHRGGFFNEWRAQRSNDVANAVSPNKLLARKGDDQVSSRATKRLRPSPEPGDNDDEDGSDSISNWSSQVDMWQTRLEELIIYRQNYGHCRVPHKWKENVALSHWVKR